MKIFILCISVVLFTLPAFAETYTWVDDQGTVNFTEDLGNVPAKYRKKVKVYGEEEPLPAEGQPPARAKSGGTGESRAGAQGARQGKSKTMYGGKDLEAWKSELTVLNDDLQSAEKHLEETRNRMNDTSNMPRSEYLGIQSTIRSLENSVVIRKKRIEDFKREAETAGVPAGLLD